MSEHEHYEDRPHSFPATATAYLIPPTVWALALATLYAIQGAGCAGGLAEVVGEGTLRAALIMIAALAAAVIVVVGILSALRYRRLDREESPDFDRHLGRFLALGTLLNAGLFLVAMIWVSAPLLLLELC